MDKQPTSWVFPPQMERRLRGVDGAPVTLHWGIIYYIQQIAPPGVVQSSGSKNGQESWEEVFE